MKRTLLITLGITLISLAVGGMLMAVNASLGPGFIAEIVVAAALATGAWVSLSASTR
ncbi:hypothetical protein ACFYT4_00945 [Streptomyces sp. NPDC004609]|uniref:hypothetical protein n=1 Tax=Streptomyces sp. NPDC004609 TaxID=3364704 RepID=UPI00368659F6